MFCGLHELLDLSGHLVPFGVRRLAEVVRHPAQVRGPRIFGVIDAVAKAGNLFLLFEHGPDVGDRVFAFLIDLEKQPHHGFVGSAVQRALQGADGPGHGRVHI